MKFAMERQPHKTPKLSSDMARKSTRPEQRCSSAVRRTGGLRTSREGWSQGGRVRVATSGLHITANVCGLHKVAPPCGACKSFSTYPIFSAFSSGDVAGMLHRAAGNNREWLIMLGFLW